MANRQRGEVTIEGPEGKTYTLCLTLGAIAQIEEEIEGIDSLTDVDQVFSESPKMRDVITIFVALLNGGGHSDIDRKSMMTWNIPLTTLMEKIRDVFAASGFGDEDESEGN